MAAKTVPSESAPRGNRQNRRREICGILLLAGDLFSAMSLVSMQVGGEPLMGPGGGAVATGLYSLFGLCAYLVIAATSVAAVRCFRARPFIDGLREGTGALLLLCALAVLLHLPFAGERRHPARSGRALRPVAWRGRGQLHRRRRRGAGRHHDAGRRRPAGDRDQPGGGDGGRRLGRASGPSGAGGRLSRRLANRAGGVPREGRYRRAPPRDRPRDGARPRGDRHRRAGPRRGARGRPRVRGRPRDGVGAGAHRVSGE